MEFPLEILLHIFSFVEPGGGTRVSILKTCKHIRDTCLLQIWKPWDKRCLGLRKAVENGYIGYFRRWRHYTPEKELRWLNGWPFTESVMVIASRKGYLDFIKMFLRDPLSKPGGIFDPTILNWMGFRAACDAQQVKVIRYFLNWIPEDHRGNTRLPVDDALLQACKWGRSKTVKVLLEDGRACPTLLDNYCIRKACKYGHVSVVEQLLNDGRSDPNVGKGSLLVSAYKKGTMDILELLCLDWRAKVPKSIHRKLEFYIKAKCQSSDDSGLSSSEDV